VFTPEGVPVPESPPVEGFLVASCVVPADLFFFCTFLEVILALRLVSSSCNGAGVGVAGGSIGAFCTGAGVGGAEGGAGVGGAGVFLFPPPNIELIIEPHIIIYLIVVV
jgi:hypothetical protein